MNQNNLERLFDCQVAYPDPTFSGMKETLTTMRANIYMANRTTITFYLLDIKKLNNCLHNPAADYTTEEVLSLSKLINETLDAINRRVNELNHEWELFEAAGGEL